MPSYNIPLPFKGGARGGLRSRRLDASGAALRHDGGGLATLATHPLTPPLKGRGVLFFLLLLALLFLAVPAFAQTFPPLTGRVVDAAKLLSPEQEAGLTAPENGHRAT